MSEGDEWSPFKMQHEWSVSETTTTPARSVMTDATRLPGISTSHDCGSLSRVVMVRKTDQRVINHKGLGNDQCEIVTLETIQTYRGHKPERTVVIKARREGGGGGGSNSGGSLFSNTNGGGGGGGIRNIANTESDLLQSICSIPTISTSDTRSEIDTLTRSTNEISLNGSRGGGVGGGNVINIVDDTFDRFGTQYSNSTGCTTKAAVTSSTTKHQQQQLLLKTPSPIARKLSSTGWSVFELECLSAHNESRSKHGVQPLKLNKKLCRFADEWAKVIAARGNPVHRNNSPYGENIFCSWSSGGAVAVNGREPVEHWYGEVKQHQFGKEPATLKTGHFTQVVWRDSREFGVGQARNRSGQVFVVANYDPPGNFIGSFTENVPPIIGNVHVHATVKDNGVSPKTKTVTISDSKMSGGGGGDLSPIDEFARAVQKYHNDMRRKHGAPDLRLSDKLMQISQRWAETLAREDRFAHQPDSLYGENIYCLWSSDRNAEPSAKDVCRSWYEEIKEYTFGNEPRGTLRAGHFTQMVWKSTEMLGVGTAKTQKGKVLVVCNYHPRGNVIGQFNNNVLRPK